MVFQAKIEFENIKAAGPITNPNYLAPFSGPSLPPDFKPACLSSKTSMVLADLGYGESKCKLPARYTSHNVRLQADMTMGRRTIH
jgi:hypothetical protein